MVIETHDLAALPDLNETIILEYLKVRYKHDSIYTYIGDILLAINPFKQLSIYDKDSHKQYSNSSRDTAPPHVYALADHAYEGLKSNVHRSQCCVISGESGAGKTESAKHFIKHLIYLCDGNSRLELQILHVNPLLEALGNAVTLMNDNSSRFGKYIELSFVNNKVVGGKISEYLLEKSRVSFQNSGEQNFHIFYYLIAGLEDAAPYRFYLTTKSLEPIKFNYLTYHKYEFEYEKLKEKIRMKDKYDELVNAMNYVAFTDAEQNELFAALIGVLHVGNLEFTSNDDGYAVFVESDETKITLKAINRLLGINTMALISAMTTSVPTSAGGREEFIRNYTLEACLDARDALSKHIYSKLFSWLVFKVNKTLMCDKNKHQQNLIKQIGILDIYGFEHFQKNSFEQLCINLANEQIQYFFNKHIFSLEKEEYSREAINTISITFNDNQPLLDLFIGSNGILKKLDDLCKLPRTTNSSLIDNFDKEFSKNQHYIASKRNDNSFTINHYAGKVTYSGENFLEKNRDSLPFKIMELLKNSKNRILSEIFTSTATEAINESSKSIWANRVKDARTSVSAQYRNSLEVLMKRMSESKPLFLRCIKPNPSKKSDDFDEKFVLLQLRYCGILETTRIRKEGYSLRPTFQEFVERYKYLSPSSSIKFDSASCKLILNNTMLKNWRVGKSKVFLKYYHYDQLKTILDQYISYATIIQKYIRGWLATKEWNERLKYAKIEQNKVAEFSGLLTLQSENIYQTISKTAQHSIKSGRESPNYYNTNSTQHNSHTYLSPKQYDQQLIYDNLNEMKNHNTAPKLSSKQQRTELKRREPCWLYGKLTRGQSEKFLRHTELGTYLVRRSDSRDGYSLSFKAENRARHYMIDALPNGKFIIIGEPRVHKTLKDLVEYHCNHKLSNWNGYLTHPLDIDN